MVRKRRKKHGKHPEKAISAIKIRTAQPGRYADGNGLYLHVEKSGAKHWFFRTMVHGRRRDIGLGSLTLVSVQEAREEAARLRKIARIDHGDPVELHRKEKNVTPTFEQAARTVHELHAKTFRNEKHKAQWISTLEMYAFPAFGSRPIDKVQSGDVLAALSPIWTTKPETARRVRQRLKTIFKWARASGFYSGDNPAEIASEALPVHDKKTKQHFAALPYAKVPEFISALRQCNAGPSARQALELLILTATRTSEVLRARWDEINLDAKTWTIPKDRMKAKEEHAIPLSPRCMEILAAAKEIACGSSYVFPGRSLDRPLSNMALAMVLRRMKRTDITVHGFRSSFRDWAEERTRFKGSIIEAALAHAVKDKVEAAYRRTKLFTQRIPLMAAWAAFATTIPAERVIQMHA
jgi:integrase